MTVHEPEIEETLLYRQLVVCMCRKEGRSIRQQKADTFDTDISIYVGFMNVSCMCQPEQPG